MGIRDWGQDEKTRGHSMATGRRPEVEGVP